VGDLPRFSFYDHLKAARFLHDLIEEAKKEPVAEGGMGFIPGSPVGQGVLSHMRSDNLEFCFVWNKPNAGWYCDFAMKDVPAGLPSCFGSPVAYPFQTRKAAVEYARMTVRMILSTEKASGPEETAVPDEPEKGDETLISFYGAWLSIPLELIKAIESAHERIKEAGAAKQIGANELSTDSDWHHRRLSELRREFWRDTSGVPDSDFRLDQATFEQLSDGQMNMLLIALACAHRAGILRHPQIGVKKFHEDTFGKSRA
jgi:hypothetical protein